ncbi:MAG: DUF4430 domain-containing protein [Eubacterium sp.]|nr:DUF4430 domain-containing protein [Eubacterium sp.]
MNKVTKRVMALFMSLTMVLGMMTIVSADTQKTITVTMTIERFTIGQGFLVEPTNVEVKEGATVKDVMEKLAQEKNVKINATSSTYGYYLDSISYADTGKLNIPQSILDMPSIDVDYGYGPQHYDAPTNTSTNALFEDEQKLGGGSYTDLAGWMYGINNVESSVGMDSQPVKDGDVVRLQFSVYAGGADIGFTSYYENIVSAKLANKDALIKKVAATTGNDKYDAKRTDAIKVLEKYDASQEEVDSAYKKLGEEETTTPEVTTQKIKVKKATIKSAKNVKKNKIKLTIKKVAGAKGYQVRYATNKKFKKAVVKTTTKRTYTIKKLKKNKTYYVQVRAFKKAGTVRKYGAWSNRKRVKITK